MITARLRSGLALVALLLLLSATASASSQAPPPLKVVTTFTVIADMAREVGGEAVVVESIVRPGAEIHGYSPTPRDLLRVQGADLILWNGLNLERWFLPFFGQFDGLPSQVVSEGIQPLSISGGSYEGRPNPHAWMSLSNAMLYIDNIRDAFIAQDPANAALYRANAEAYQRRLEREIAPLRDMLADVPAEQRWLVSCEGAFSYLAQDLGLQELYLWPVNADELATPQQIRRVIDAVRARSIPVIFCESTVPNAPALQVARETDARFGGALYVDSLSAAEGPVPSYLDLLRVTIETIAAGLSGAGTAQ